MGCDNGEKVRVAFALDCCDREAIAHVATAEGIKGEDVPDLIITAVESRFGHVNRLSDTIEWLSDNGSDYILAPRRIARRRPAGDLHRDAGCQCGHKDDAEQDRSQRCTWHREDDAGQPVSSPVHVKTLTSQNRRALLTARKLLQGKAIATENDIRALLRNFGLKVGNVGVVKFEERIRELVDDMADLQEVMDPLLTARRKLREEFSRLHKVLDISQR